MSAETVPVAEDCDSQDLDHSFDVIALCEIWRALDFGSDEPSDEAVEEGRTQ